MFEKEFEEIKSIAKKHNISHYDAYLSTSHSLSIRIFHGDIDSFNYSDALGLGLRIIIGERTGYAYTEKLDRESLEATLCNARDNARIVDYKEEVKLGNYPPITKKLDIYSEALSKISVEDKIKKAKEIEKASYDSDKRIVNVPQSIIGNNESYVKIANSCGMTKEYITNACYGLSFCLAKKDDETKSGYFEHLSRNFNDINAVEISSRAAKKAIELLGAREISSGNYPVLFNNEMAATLLSTFWGIFSAKAVHEGQSLLKGQLHKEIASPHLTIIDDALLDGGYNTRPLDDEGYPSQTTELITAGTLNTYLHNSITALKDGIPSTGNASRSYKTTIGISPSNLYIKPGISTKKEISSSVKNYIEIVQLAGMHSGCNTISGDFSMSAQGFYCENSERKYPIHNFTVSGNFFNLMKQIIGIAEDLSFKLSAIGAPSILVDELSISG